MSHIVQQRWGNPLSPQPDLLLHRGPDGVWPTPIARPLGDPNRNNQPNYSPWLDALAPLAHLDISAAPDAG
ncbi:hypothetical protein [Mycobacterium leprae]|uniref:hypothetical protein n=1 Tax=Mycobacterium leprae TaxID=1769 RepID=UPI0012E82775|nr:hypothetical protein [Mycobacterium leprae]